jgi:hypothetical protein
VAAGFETWQSNNAFHSFNIRLNYYILCHCKDLTGIDKLLYTHVSCWYAHTPECGKFSSAFVDLFSKQDTARKYKKAHTRAEQRVPILRKLSKMTRSKVVYNENHKMKGVQQD